MKIPLSTLLATATLAAGLCSAGAALAAGPTLYNTGVGADGLALTSNAVDPHYSIVGSPVFGPAAYVKTEADGQPIAPGGWLLDSPTSAWITPSIDFFFGDVPGVTDQISYRTQFNLSGFVPAGGRIEGRWAADDTGLEIRLNGVAVPGLTQAQYDRWTFFSIDGGFVDGVNTLEFETRSTQNPTGVRVEFSSAVFAVPEPGTWALMGAGLLGVMSLARRRQ